MLFSTKTLTEMCNGLTPATPIATTMADINFQTASSRNQSLEKQVIVDLKPQPYTM